MVYEHALPGRGSSRLIAPNRASSRLIAAHRGSDMCNSSPRTPQDPISGNQTMKLTLPRIPTQPQLTRTILEQFVKIGVIRVRQCLPVCTIFIRCLANGKAKAPVRASSSQFEFTSNQKTPPVRVSLSQFDQVRLSSTQFDQNKYNFFHRTSQTR